MSTTKTTAPSTTLRDPYLLLAEAVFEQAVVDAVTTSPRDIHPNRRVRANYAIASTWEIEDARRWLFSDEAEWYAEVLGRDINAVRRFVQDFQDQEIRHML